VHAGCVHLQEDRRDEAQSALDEVPARDPGQSDEPAKRLAAAGLSLALLRKETLRSQAGLPVEGCVVVASGS